MHQERSHIAIGIIINQKSKEILISKRHDNVSQGGFWEFPGGKLKIGESIENGLNRELIEETGIVVEDARPLIKFDHDYPGNSVTLDVWLIRQWSGIPHGREGQIIKWIPIHKLNSIEFPSANKPIISSIILPSLYWITPDLDEYDEIFLYKVKNYLKCGLRLIQFRCKTKEILVHERQIRKLIKLCKAYKAKLLINSVPELAVELGADGIHLDSKRLMNIDKRPLNPEYLVAASCHNSMELKQAEKIDADFAVLSPLHKTDSHPWLKPIGWKKFSDFVETTSIPVYALGGLKPDEVYSVYEHGGQGVAMISGLWEEKDYKKAITCCLD